MKENTIIYKVIRNFFIMYVFLLCFGTTNAQVSKQFTQRTSTKALQPYTGKTIYNLRGDFEMLGNTNLVKTPYDDTSTNNGTNMAYVDIDGDNTTANSSAAYLNIPSDGCTKVVYAGLYWNGRAQQTSNSDQYTFTTNYSTLGANGNVNAYHNTSNLSYALTISQGGTNNNRYPVYTLRLNNIKTIVIHLTNSTNNRALYYEDGSTTAVNLPGSYSNGVFDVNPDKVFTVNGKNYTITSLNRSTGTSNNTSYTNNTNFISLNAPTVATSPKAFDKRKVKIKKEGGTYQEVTAAAGDIWYPNNGTSTSASNQDFIYASYVDVTDIVTSGGRYYVADMALSEGSSAVPGYSGGWGMVVIYENPNMKWRDITVFDGHAYVMHNSTTVNQIALNGFRAAQAGAIKVDMGFLAAEGEIDLTGDYFRMRRADITTTSLPTNTSINNTSAMNNALSSANGTVMPNYPYITTAGTTRTNNNFFNSSIDNGYGQFITLPNTQVESRTPFYKNNYGFDLAKISLDNADKKFIKNNQTNTIFYYGSAGDTYVIYNVVFAVDAYVPETEVFAKITPTPGVDINNLQPNDEVTLTAEIYNYGTDAIKDAKLAITIPPGMQLISASSVPQTQSGSGATAPFSFNQPTWINPVSPGSNALPASSLGGVLEWVLNNVPTQNLVSGNKVPMAVLTYKLKVTNNCMVLQASANNCILLPEIAGEIEGTGVLSGTPFTQKLVTGYNIDCNNTPKYDNLKMEIKPSSTFLNACSASNPIVNEVRMFKRFCAIAGNAIPRAEITGVYPAGTKFYTDADVEVTANFAVDSNGAITYYRAVLPGAPISCYLKLATQLDVITTTPTVNNVSACQGEPIVLNNEASNTTYQLFYFQNQADTTPISGAPAPTTVGTHTYWVAEGTTNGGATCFGAKVSFTITINAVPTAVNLTDLEFCTFANYVSTINPNGATVVWEYWSGTSWVALSNQLGGVSIVSNQLKITKAPVALNGTKVRVKLTNTNNCSSNSDEITLTVKGCKMPVNPMIYTPLNR